MAVNKDDDSNSKPREKFNTAKPKIWFSSTFIKRHIFDGDPEKEKKKAEAKFADRRTKGKQGTARPIKTSTVICVKGKELIKLAAEVYLKQAEFEKDSGKSHTTREKYLLWIRGEGGSGTKKAAKPKKTKFKYTVTKDGDRWVMHHFGGTAG